MDTEDLSQRATMALTTARSPSPLKSGGHRDPRVIEAKAVELKGQFLARMLEPMFDGIDTDGPGGGGFAEGMWRSLMVDEYGMAVARSGGVGLAKHVMAELLRLQEKADGGAK